MTKYTVFKGNGDMRVVIALDGYGPNEAGFTEVGSFTHGIDAMSNNETDAKKLDLRGDHVLIAKAKEVLRDSGDFDNVNLDSLTYLDRASNAPVHADQGVTTDAMLTSGVDPDPEVSTQLGGDHSEENNSQIDTTQNSDTETVHAQDGEGGTQERIADEEGSTKQSGSETSENDSEGNAEVNETVAQLKERIADVTDKNELQGIYDAEKAGKDRPTAIAAIEARAAELNEAA